MTPIITFTPKEYDIFIGLDVDKTSFSFTVNDHNTMRRSKKIPASPEQFYNYIQNHFPDQKVLCAYEAGPTGYDLYDYLSNKKQGCMVVSPMSIPKAPNEKVKNNRIDSQRITQELKAGKLKPIRVPEGYYRELRHLINLRENYARSRKTAKQRIKALLLYTGLHKALKDTNQNWSNKYIQSLKELSCSMAVSQRLDMLLMDLDYAREQTLSILKALKSFNYNHKEIRRYTQYLMSIPGIGFITAVSLLGRIGNPYYLRNVRELSAFLGLVPKEKSTGNTISQGSITHLGNYTLRALIIEASWSSIRKDTQLAQFYHRIEKRHHSKIASKKAIVAVARKLTHRIYCVLKEQRMYTVR